MVLHDSSDRGARVLNDEVIAALEPFFDWIGPRHDELDRVISRSRLSHFDPAEYEEQASKRHRIRTVLAAAIDGEPTAGRHLVAQLITLIRANDGFVAGSEDHPGAAAVGRLQRALAREGFELTSDGQLRATVLDGLEGREMSAALRAYVERARAGSADAALLVGTSKDLVEATAKHVLDVNASEARRSRQFPRLLEEAFSELGLPTAHWDDFKARSVTLDAPTEWERVVQALNVLGRAINDLRNAEGTGHGRPELTSLDELQSRVTAEAAAVVASLMLQASDAADDQAPRRAS